MSSLDPIYSNIATVEASERYWSIAVLGSLHGDACSSDNLPLVLRISPRLARTARLPRISAELVATDAFRECFHRLSRGLEHCEDMGERYEAMIEVAQVAAKQARLVLFSPTLSGAGTRFGEGRVGTDGGVDRRSSSAHREGVAGGRLQAIRADGPLPSVDGGGAPFRSTTGVRGWRSSGGTMPAYVGAAGGKLRDGMA